MNRIDVTCAIIIKEGKLLACQRGPRSEHAYEWEFPGGKVEDGESPEACIVREIWEELKVDILVLKQLTRLITIIPVSVFGSFPSFAASMPEIHRRSNTIPFAGSPSIALPICCGRLPTKPFLTPTKRPCCADPVHHIFYFVGIGFVGGNDAGPPPDRYHQ